MLHRAVFHAMALLDLEPVYLERPWLAEEGVPGPLDPALVEKKLTEYPEIKTACITSPTYAGVLSDTAAIGALLYGRGGKLFVDGAHGAHLPFLGVDAFSGADGVVVSAHKTLPALGSPPCCSPGASIRPWSACGPPSTAAPAPPTPCWPAWMGPASG